ncbi:MAG: GLPGLI family protein [Saprospiraceae bacterium]|nr:GLPGLI family protein [Saprospiraceae bacterium]
MIIFLFVIYSLAYQVETDYVVWYSFSHCTDTNCDNGQSKSETHRLYKLGSESRYLAENEYYNDSIFLLEDVNGQLSNLTPSQSNLDKIMNSNFAKNRKRSWFDLIRVSKDFEKNSYAIYQKSFTDGIMKLEENKSFIWQISEEKAEIDGIACIRATTSYGGRNWICWFAPSIPIFDGPYVFSGLPGLILKLEDEESIYKWEMTAYTTHPIAVLHKDPMFNNGTFRDVDRKEFIRAANKTVNGSNSQSVVVDLSTSAKIQKTLSQKRYLLTEKN